MSVVQSLRTNQSSRFALNSLVLCTNIAASDIICKKFAEMKLVFTLFFALFLARTSSIREVHQEVDKSENSENSPLHLPLYHVQSLPHSVQNSDSPLPFSQTLDLDEARVKFLSSRLTNKNSTKSGRLVDGKSVSVPLNPGEPLGIANYYTKIGIGTPTTNHLVVMDTGSSFSWIQCEPCAVYCHTQVGPRFNPSASVTYQKLPCDASQCSSLKKATLNSPMCSSSNVCLYTSTYGDQSFSMGYLSKDLLTIGSESLQGFVFGCGQDNNGLFGRSAGLIGLAKDELSMLSQLSTKYGNAFSYCLPTATPFGKTGSGGFLSIGTSSNPGYKFTPMLSDARDSTLYFLKLSAISVSGGVLKVAATEYSVPTIIDSGTTISRLRLGVYSALRDAVVKVVSSKFRLGEPISILDACFVGGFDEISKVVPPVKMVFQGGAELNLAPQNVLIEVEKGTTCLSFAGSDGDIAIIGNQQQQTFGILYEVASSRIGFAAGGCS